MRDTKHENMALGAAGKGVLDFGRLECLQGHASKHHMRALSCPDFHKLDHANSKISYGRRYQSKEQGALAFWLMAYVMTYLAE